MEFLKKSIPRLIVVIILISMITIMFAPLQSCENDMDFGYQDSESELQHTQKSEDKTQNKQDAPLVENQESTDRLVVYMTIDNEKFLTPALNIFKEKYPEVEVEVVAFASEVISSGNSTSVTTPDEFRIRLTTELAAGQGPDLVLAETRDFPDIYKTMASGVFVDLNQFIESDRQFSMDEYNQAVLDCGVYQGKRYIIPYEYEVPILVTTQEILDAEGINPADLSTFDGFIKITEKYNEKYKDNPNKSVFRNYQTNSHNLGNFFPNCGIALIDYQTNKVGIDKAKFKSIIDIMKKTYMYEEGISVGSNLIDYEGLRDQNWIFHLERYVNNSTLTYLLYDMLDADNLTPLYFKYPNIYNGVNANVRCFAAIRKTSKNQISAYNLLKIILSDEIQTGNMYLLGNPVLKSAVRPRGDWAMSVMGVSNLKDEKSINEYLDMLINVDSCKMTPYAPYYVFLIEEMTPYFNGTRSFDDCYDRLVSKLEIYISE